MIIVTKNVLIVKDLLIPRDVWKFLKTLIESFQSCQKYPVDNAIGFPRAYPLSSDLPGGKRYPTLEQPGPEHLAKRKNV